MILHLLTLMLVTSQPSYIAGEQHVMNDLFKQQKIEDDAVKSAFYHSRAKMARILEVIHPLHSHGILRSIVMMTRCFIHSLCLREIVMMTRCVIHSLCLRA